ncbi:MAG: metallophosphoesterase family protein [Clostridia bacterium]|nr:metallophosphoesterase family protein [Clostridia bacterium]
MMKTAIPQTKIPLRFREDGSFRVLMVSDIHGGVGYNKTKTVAALDGLIEAEDPDLVVFGGDTAGPGVIHISNVPELREMLDGLAAPMEERGIPWCHVFGNHDDNYGLPNEEAETVYESFPHCVSTAGPEEISGVGNYVLPVYSADGEKLLLNLFALDSHSGMREWAERWGVDPKRKVLPSDVGDRGDYDTVNVDQVLWYYTTSRAIEAEQGRKIPAVLFTHIPLPEMHEASKHRRDVKLRGIHWEDVACTSLNSGLFRACLERGDVRGIFFGHDHENDFEVEYMGIRMAYDASLSYHACQINELRGGRVIDFHASDPAAFTTRTVKIADILGHAGDSEK